MPIRETVEKNLVSIEEWRKYAWKVKKDGDVEILVIKEYYKDGKSKSVWKIYTDDGVEIAIIQYATLNSNELVTMKK